MQASLAHLGFVDWCVVVSAVCSVLLLIYVAADHLPKIKPMLDKAETKPRRYLPYILAAVAWFGVIIEIGDRHWWGGPEPTEIPLSEENARIDVSRWQPITNDKKQFLTNVYLANNGKSTALRWGFQGYAVAGALLDKDLVDAFFIVLRTKAKAAPLVDAEFQVGQSNIFISVPNIPPFIQWDDSTLQAYKDGKVPVFTFIVFMYSDAHIPAGKHIYGEKCALIIQDIVHNCASHNHNFIAD